MPLRHLSKEVTRQAKPCAVLLGIDEFRALVSSSEDPLDRLHDSTDALVAKMQTPAAIEAGRALFGSAE